MSLHLGEKGNPLLLENVDTKSNVLRQLPREQENGGKHQILKT